MIGGKKIAHLDTETTGTNIDSAKIIELAVVIDGDPPVEKTYRFNPGTAIPPEATAVHGIKDSDVAGMPAFKDLAGEILSLLDGCVISGYNVKAYDIPLLKRELSRALPNGDPRLDALNSVEVIDTFEIFKRHEGMRLGLAYKFYTGRDIEGAHGALADTKASMAVLDAQLKKYCSEYPNDSSQIATILTTKPKHFVDSDGKFIWKDGEVTFSFSRWRGTSLRSVSKLDRGFIKWMMQSDFSEQVKNLAKDALDGRFPEPEAV